MSKLKGTYFAGVAAEALEKDPVTLRMWRDRGYCDFGAVEEGMESNPRARRRYTLAEICLMGVAVTLNRLGWDMEEAFSRVSNDDQFRQAVAAVIVNLPHPDTLFTFVMGDGWSNSLLLSAGEWKAFPTNALDAQDTLTGSAAEVVMAVNVSAIARRVLAKLPNASGSDEA
jgi:hypothetical protein